MSIRPLGGETTSAHMHRPMVATIMSGPRGQEERRGTKRKTDRRSNKKTTRAPVGVHTHMTVHTIHTTSALTRSPHLEGSASSRRPRGATRGQGYRYSTEVPCRYYFLEISTEGGGEQEWGAARARGIPVPKPLRKSLPSVKQSPSSEGDPRARARDVNFAKAVPVAGQFSVVHLQLNRTHKSQLRRYHGRYRPAENWLLTLGRRRAWTLV